MPDGTFEIVGGKELEELLKQLPDKVALRIEREALPAGGQVIVDLAKAKAPVLQGHVPSTKGHPHSPGMLRDSIGFVKARLSRDFLRLKIGILRENSAFWAFWGHFVEFGTAPSEARVSRKGRRYAAHHATQAYPFMRPAADEGKEAAVAAFMDAVRAGIEKEAAKRR